MNELIALYLFQNKTCPLPGVGSLSIGDRTASYVLGEKQLHPPLPYISFSPAERSADDFIIFLSSSLRISKDEAVQKLEEYSSRLRGLDAYSELEIPFTGKFYVDVEGSLIFKQVHFLESILSPVHAEKVIHPESTHTILVGDKESNSALMTEFYTGVEQIKRSRWWISAIILFLFALTAIVLYYNDRENGFGNTNKVPAATEGSTYSTPN